MIHIKPINNNSPIVDLSAIKIVTEKIPREEQELNIITNGTYEILPNKGKVLDKVIIFANNGRSSAVYTDYDNYIETILVYRDNRYTEAKEGK